MIIYKPTPPCSISIGESILRTEIQEFFEVLYPIFLNARPHLDLVTSENELREVLDSAVDQVIRRPVVCFCFPHELPKNVSSELYLALPTFFEVVSDLEEYSLPVEMWVESIKELDGVLVASSSLKNLVLEITSSEVPVYQLFTFLDNAEKNEFDFHGIVNEQRVLIPCRSFINSNDGPWYGEENSPATAIERFGSNDRTGEIFSCDLGGMGTGDIWPIGFYPVETWGAWAESKISSLVIPLSVCGQIQTSVSILAIGKNIGREIEVRIGDSSQKIQLKESLNTYIIDFDIATPVNQIFFDGYVIDTDVDSRGLGIGIQKVEIFKLPSWDAKDRSWNFTNKETHKIYTTGFFPMESWGNQDYGAWARSATSSISLPISVVSELQLTVHILAIGKNIGREIEVRIGDSSQKIRLKESLNAYVIDFDITTPVSQIFFYGYVIDTDVDSRGLGIGISAFKIAKKRSLFSRAMHRLSGRRVSICNATTLDTDQDRSAHSDPTLELSGRIYVMELRAIDLMFDNWIEVLKVYSLAFEDNKDVNLLIVCPSNLAKFMFPFATQFFNRMDPRSTLIHFVFVDDPSDSFHSLQKYQDLVLVRRADGKEFDTYLEQYDRQWVTIGPTCDDCDADLNRDTTFPVSVRRQIRNMLYGEFLPVVLTSDYDNEQLLQAFVESSRCRLINTSGPINDRRHSSPLPNAIINNIAVLQHEKEVQ